MKRRIAVILLTATILWALIEETAARLINSLMGSREAEFIQTFFQETESQELDSSQTGSPEGIAQWIEEAAEINSLDPAIIRAVIGVESGGNPSAVSNKGACGLMQLMPETSRILQVTDPFDPKENIIGGATYLRGLLDEFGNLDLALAAYNAGPAVIKRHGGIPPYKETQDYVRSVKMRLAELKQRGE